jgi:hypothetical protein
MARLLTFRRLSICWLAALPVRQVPLPLEGQKELSRNVKLTRLVSELSLEELVLKDIASEDF